MPRERAGLARALIIFVVALAALGFIYGILNGPAETMLSAASDVSDSPQAAQGQQWIAMFWDAIPFIGTLLLFVMLLGAAAAERRLPGQ